VDGRAPEELREAEQGERVERLRPEEEHVVPIEEPADLGELLTGPQRREVDAVDDRTDRSGEAGGAQGGADGIAGDRHDDDGAIAAHAAASAERTDVGRPIG